MDLCCCADALMHVELCDTVTQEVNYRLHSNNVTAYTFVAAQEEVFSLSMGQTQADEMRTSIAFRMLRDLYRSSTGTHFLQEINNASRCLFKEEKCILFVCAPA